jgi:predicted aconitase with swiveling domain
MSAGREIAARGIVEGKAAGPAMISAEAISFLGDLDIRSGAIVGDLKSVKGKRIAGSVLIMPYTRGSAGAWRFLHQLFKHGNAPVAMITGTVPDPSVVQGAILSGIPIACEPELDVAVLVRDGDRVEVSVDGERATIRIGA